MKIIHRHEDCVGITLFRWGRFNLEIWFCPKYYQIVEHKHPKEHIELMFLYGGETVFFRRESLTSPYDSVVVKFPRNIFHRFTVKPNHYHWFSVGPKPLVFLNFSRWKAGTTPTSAADDFVEAPTTKLKTVCPTDIHTRHQ